MSNRQVRLNFRLGSGIFVLLLVMFGMASVPSVAAQDDPPPRPTLSPTETPQPSPTSVPPTPTAAQPQNPPTDPSTPEPRGRIIGTVIDLTTGAPAAGIAVAVGDAVVRTDANGNYERGNLPAGQYIVQLQLSAEQGTPAQEPVTVALPADATIVQHLTFRSVAQATPAPTGTAAPPTSAPTTAPPPTVEPTVPPPMSSPTTAPPAVVPPRALPDTGEDVQSYGWLMGLGALLIMLGIRQIRQVRRTKSRG